MSDGKSRLTRRTFISVGSGVVAGLGLTTFSPDAAFAGVRGLSVTAGELRNISFFDGAFRTLLAVEVPAQITITGARDEKLVLKFAFDKRLVSLGDVAVILHGSTASVRPIVVGDGVADLAIPLGKNMAKAGAHRSELTVALPFRSTDLYPNENLDGVVPLSITVTNGSRHAELVAAPAVIREAVPWGAEVAARWSETAAGDDILYPYPTSVLLTSTGPNSIPAGAQLTVHTDRRVVSTSSVEQILAGQPDAAPDGTPMFATTTYDEAGYSLLVAELQRAVPPGEIVELTLASSIADAPPSTGLLSAYVSVAADEKAAGDQRASGRLASSKSPHKP